MEFQYVLLQKCQIKSYLPCLEAHRGAFSAAQCGVSGLTSVSGSVGVTLGEDTSMGFILGPTLVDGAWMGLTL
jgi:hypothetical protein